MQVIGIIPSRYQSSRFPGKPLANILGKSMVQRVYEQCKKCSALSDVIVATDEIKIYNHVLEFGGKVMMTSKKHRCGTERCNEVAQKLYPKSDIIVNIQGDEPFINPSQISEVINLFNTPEIEISTLAKEIKNVATIKNKNCPKVIFGNNSIAIDFQRTLKTISNNQTYYKHIGIYAFKTSTLNTLCVLPESINEKKNQLEQLRWIDNGYIINVGITTFESPSVDTPNDITKIEADMK